MENPTKTRLLELVNELARSDDPYFSQDIVLASNESDPSLPGLVWRGTNSPKPSLSPTWRVVKNPAVTEVPVDPEIIVLWLGQVLSAQVGREIATRILKTVVENDADPNILEDISKLDRFSRPDQTSQQSI